MTSKGPTGELTADAFLELCARLRSMGVARATFGGNEVIFFPPEPVSIGADPRAFEPEKEELEVEDETRPEKRARLRREINAQSLDLYGSA